ncbi:MAG: alpha/beta hydrolase [Saccharofermentanales bacterium]
MSRRKQYKIHKQSHPMPFLVRFFVIPLTVIAILLVFIGIYTFANANILMRQKPKALEDFANNILPAYTNASFPSLDGITNISGWFFSSKQKPVSTVIMVHEQGNNRLQFDVDTAALYDYFVNNGFNVLSFDLRHSGNSKGNLSTFGYAEWADVIAAISYVRRISSTKNVILYGFGSGISSCLIAMEKINPLYQESESVSSLITDLEFDSSYVHGLILDSPDLTSDDYIRESCRSKILLGRILGQYTIPYAVRLSAEAGRNYNLAAIIARTQIPVHLIYRNKGDRFTDERVQEFVNERHRLFPNLTAIYTLPVETTQTSFNYDIDNYMTSIDDFLSRFFK